jgi:hypothetical protein
MELDRFRQIASLLYPPFKPTDGIAFEEIEKIEKRKKLTLPKVLRDFYHLSANHEPINYSFNRLIGIEELEIEKGKLVFYQENQGVCVWAIDKRDLQKNDPPVWQGQPIPSRREIDWYSEHEDPLVFEPQWNTFDDNKIEWHQETSLLSTFLTSMLCWQSVMGGLPFCAVREHLENSTIGEIEDNFEPVDFGNDYQEFQVFVSVGKILCLLRGDNGIALNIAASDKTKFLELSQLLSIEWDYNSWDDA